MARIDIDMEGKEEEDQLLLDSLGVTSANPEDIEHHILTETKADAAEDDTELKDGIEGDDSDNIPDAKASSGIWIELRKRLRALEVEIDAVAAGQPHEGSNMWECLLFMAFIAMNHDVIMNANDEEKMRLQEEASQVAQRAAEALGQSRALRSQDRISTPTWTGRLGAAGAPSSMRKKFGSAVNSKLVNASKHPNASLGAGLSVGKALSSSELLAKIHGAQESAIGTGLEDQLRLVDVRSSNNIPNYGKLLSSVLVASSSICSIGDIQPDVLIQRLCAFIQEKGGSTSSATIVEHFKAKVSSKDLPLFKNLLKKIATLDKRSTGSKWILKQEYRH